MKILMYVEDIRPPNHAPKLKHPLKENLCQIPILNSGIFLFDVAKAA